VPVSATRYPTQKDAMLLNLARGALVLTLLTLAVGCSAMRQRGPVVERERTTVQVQNQNFLDMTVYVWSGQRRVRIGTVTGLSTQVLNLPANMVFGSATVRFEMNPIGSRARPMSQEITVREGDQIILVIPYS
jgi:hypothetical protein